MRPATLTLTALGIASLAVVAASGFSCGEQDPPKTAGGEKAADFSARGSDDKEHTLASLSANGKTLVLYFVKNGCGANPNAVPLFKKVSEPFLESEKVNFVSVFNDDATAYGEFRKEYGVKYLTLFDPGHEVIKAYGIKSSQGAVAIKDGMIVKRWKGYSKESLQELGDNLATANGTRFDVDLSDAPGRERFG